MSLDTLASLGDTQDGFSPPEFTSAPPRARLSQDPSPLAPSDPPARPAKVDQKVAELERGIARCRTLLDESPADHPKRTAWTQTIADFRCFLKNRKIQDAQNAQKDRASIQQNLKYKLAQAPEDDPKRALWENEVDRVTNKIKMEQARLRVMKTAASAPKSDVGPPKPTPPLASSSASASDISSSSVTDTGPTPAPASTSNSSPDHTVDPAPGPTSSSTAPKPRRVDEPTTSWADVFNQAWDEPSKSTITNTTRETPAEHTSGAEAVQSSPLLPDQSEPAESQSPSEEVESDTQTTTPLVDTARETASDLTTSASETIAEVQEAVAEKAVAAKEAVLDAVSSVKETVEETMASIKDQADPPAAPETAQVKADKDGEGAQVEQAEPLTIEVPVEPEPGPEAEVVAQEAEEQVVEATEEVLPAAAAEAEAEAEVTPEAIPAAAAAEAEVEHTHAPTSLDPILEHVREAVEEKEDKEEEAKAAEEEKEVEGEKLEVVEPAKVEAATVGEDVASPSPSTELEPAVVEQPKEAEVKAEVEKMEDVRALDLHLRRQGSDLDRDLALCRNSERQRGWLI